MAQERDLTFITENIPPATSFIQSGKSLRAAYAGRKEAKYIVDAIQKGQDPTTIDPKNWATVRDGWKEEANKIYPDEGDYKVWLVAENGTTPVPIGSRVEFIGGIRENAGRNDIKPDTTPPPIL